MWSFVPGFGDAARGHWPSLGLGGIAYASDGLYWLDETTGTRLNDYSVDYWGQTAIDDRQFYVVNTWFVDGPQMFVGAYSADGQSLWTQNQAGARRLDQDGGGGMALDGDTLFFAPRYDFPYSPPSGVFAFDINTGNQKWFFPCTPIGPTSATGGSVYIVASTITLPVSLIALNETDGSVRWAAAEPSLPVNGPPIVVDRWVITRSFSDVSAFDVNTGNLSWRRGDLGFSAFPNDTGMAAARGSNTLIVLEPYPISVHVLNLADGSDRWSGLLPGSSGRLSNPIIVGNRFYIIDSGTTEGPPSVLAYETPPP